MAEAYISTGNMVPVLQALADLLTNSPTSDFPAAVADAWAKDHVLNWNGGNVTLTAPILLQASTNKFGFGIRGNGAQIISNFNNAAQPAITIEVPIVGGNVVQGINVRNIQITDINFKGSSPYKGGLEFRCLSNGSWINSLFLANLTCENHAEYAYRFVGSVFEFVGDKLKSTGGVGGAWAEKAGKTGVAGDTDMGLPSAMELNSPNFRDGSGHAISLFCVASYSEPFDLTVRGGYIVSNGKAGINAPAGISMVDGTGFENNNGGAAIILGYRGGIIKGNTRAANPVAAATLSPAKGMAYLVNWWGASGRLILEDCTVQNEGAGTGLNKVAKADGGTVYLNRSGTQAAALDVSGTPLPTVTVTAT